MRDCEHVHAELVDVPAASAPGFDKPGAKGELPCAARPPRRALHGVLLIDKPLGWTSHDALARCKGLLRALKGGHTGTLDPLATGLLPLCFGAATKFSQVSLDADKVYRATLRLGQRTSTGDGEGEVVEERLVAVDRTAVVKACARFSGEIEQLPPMHSALKHRGKALYEYARQGIEVERMPRRVRIHRIDIVSWQSPLLVIDVACSKGTYIRTLAEDIGAALGCGAHLAALRRTQVGPLRLADALTLPALEAMGECERSTCLLPPQVLLTDWPEVQLPAEEAARFLTGLRRRVALPDASRVRVHQGGSFLGTAHIKAGELIADRLLSPAEVQTLYPNKSPLDPEPSAVTATRTP